MPTSTGFTRQGDCAKHAVFDHWLDENGTTNATEIAAEFYVMTGQWADELSGGQPRAENESFYLLVSLKLGSPEQRYWIEENAAQFYAMWKEFSGSDNEGPEVLIQYLLWYQRETPSD